MIRFACPGCKSVLAGRDEHAGTIVVCPKCGQRMQAPRLLRATPGKQARRRRPWIANIVCLAAVLLAGGGGVWLGMHTLNHKPESSAEGIDAATIQERTPQPQPIPENRTAIVSEQPEPQPISENRTITVKEQPPQSSADVRSSGSFPRQDEKPPIEEKKEVDRVDNLSPELLFDLVDAINAQRARAGVGPIFLDPEASRACQARAEQLAQQAGRLRQGGQEKEFVATDAPLAAVASWLKEPKRRAVILGLRLQTFGAGFARKGEGQWFSVFDWTCGFDQGPPLDATPVTGAVVYPAPGQRRVPLWFPDNETPDPLPQVQEKLVGYPVTLTFPPQTFLEDVRAHLSTKEDGEVAVWLSSPARPANPQFTGLQQNTICLIAKKPLRPNTRYHVEASARVNGTAWSAQWDFATLSLGEVHQELAGTFVRLLNRLRRRAGLAPVPLNPERCKACTAHARYLGQNAPGHPSLNWNAERADLPGYTAEGAAAARTAAIQGGGGPREAAAGLIDSLFSRSQVLDPCLDDLGLGYTPFTLGGWIWVIDLHRGAERDAHREYFYPAPDQENVPLIYPPNEMPSPVPKAEQGDEERLAGYAITVLFGAHTQVTAATAQLVDDKGHEQAGWLSTPAKPALAGFPQRCLCLLPKAPLRPDTRYTVTFQAKVNGRPWRRTWSFTTLKEPDRYSDDLDEQVLARVNAVRKAAGLPPVHLDAELSSGCQSHARYLARNQRRPEVQGMGMHRQDANLPDASPQGARAAKESVIAVVLDPQTCVDSWMATLYHRLPLLAPDLERIGFGHARIQGYKWVCVLDAGNGRASQVRKR